MSLLTRKEIEGYMEMADTAPPAERAKVKLLLEMDRVERCKESFVFFAKQM